MRLMNVKERIRKSKSKEREGGISWCIHICTLSHINLNFTFVIISLTGNSYKTTASFHYEIKWKSRLLIILICYFIEILFCCYKTENYYAHAHICVWICIDKWLGWKKNVFVNLVIMHHHKQECLGSMSIKKLSF